MYDSGLNIVSANASSYKVENGRKEDRYYYPDNVLDGDYNTAWVEAADGLGEGEWISLELEGEQEVSGVNIENGYKKFIDGKSDDYLYNCNARAKTIRVEFSDGTYEDFELTDDFYAINQIMFSYPRVTNYIKITILDAYAGSKYEDTCISEISLF